MVENEVVFRQRNESVQRNLDEVRKLGEETNQAYLVHDDDAAMHFMCECSDENCRKRIKMSPSEYNKIHKNRNSFVMLCGHESTSVERVVRQEPGYCVVRKFNVPPEKVAGLQPTDVDNV